jgi:hypothetical protein
MHKKASAALQAGMPSATLRHNARAQHPTSRTSPALVAGSTTHLQSS